MDYEYQVVTVSFTVPITYDVGDYAMLFGDGADGSVDYVVPLENNQYPLFINDDQGEHVLSINYEVTILGYHLFAAVLFDEAGNENTGTPQEIGCVVPLDPVPPAIMTFNSYIADDLLLNL